MPTTTSAIIRQFGVPPGLETEKDIRVPQPDEETTDNGSSLSDNEASTASESLSHEAHPALCAFLAPPPAASRRSALQEMGQKVLGNITLQPSGSGQGRKKAKARPTNTGSQSTSAKMKQPATAAAKPVPHLQNNCVPLLVVPPKQEPARFHPLKVESCASFDVDVKCPLDPRLPAKKHPLFNRDPDGHMRAFDPYCPLKKRVPEFLLQDPVCVVRP